MMRAEIKVGDVYHVDIGGGFYWFIESKAGAVFRARCVRSGRGSNWRRGDVAEITQPEQLILCRGLPNFEAATAVVALLG
jgi:hypothetical protein